MKTTKYGVDCDKGFFYISAMKKVSILVPETAVPAAIVDPRYMFTAVNEFYKSAGHQPFF